MKLFGGIAVALVIGLSAGGALAQSSGGLAVDLQNQRGAGAVNGPAIGGNVTTDVNVGGDVRATAEENSTASNRAGSVTGGAIGGNFDSRVRVGGDLEAVARQDSCAENNLGSVGAPACGN